MCPLNILGGYIFRQCLLVNLGLPNSARLVGQQIHGSTYLSCQSIGSSCPALCANAREPNSGLQSGLRIILLAAISSVQESLKFN